MQGLFKINFEMYVQSGPLPALLIRCRTSVVRISFFFALIGQKRSVIHQLQLKVSITDIQRFLNFVANGPVSRKITKRTGSIPPPQVLPLALLEVGSTWNKFFLTKSDECYGTCSYFSGNVRPGHTLRAEATFSRYELACEM